MDVLRTAGLTGRPVRKRSRSATRQRPRSSRLRNALKHPRRGRSKSWAAITPGSWRCGAASTISVTCPWTAATTSRMGRGRAWGRIRFVGRAPGQRPSLARPCRSLGSMDAVLSQGQGPVKCYQGSADKESSRPRVGPARGGGELHPQLEGLLSHRLRERVRPRGTPARPIPLRSDS